MSRDKLSRPQRLAQTFAKIHGIDLAMPEAEKPFESLGHQFEELSRSMGECHDPVRRRELLRQMKIILDEITKLAMDSQQLSTPPLDSSPDAD
jgi:hypothetical protein